MRRMMVVLSAAGLSAAVLAGASAGANEAVQPKADEIRLTLKLNERSISFVSRQEPMARRTMIFEGQEYAPTEEMRTAAAELAPLLAAARTESAFVITAYAADPVVAYRRARAVRGELIERHQISAARIVAAGRAAPGHEGGATIIDVHEIDPAACSGCGSTPFRSIAYDSGTMRLVTMLPERLAAASTPAAAVRQAAPPTPAPRAAPSKAAGGEARLPAPRRAIVAADPAPSRAAGACPRPRIIIDDYYPGGPLVPCRADRRGSRG